MSTRGVFGLGHFSREEKAALAACAREAACHFETVADPQAIQGASPHAFLLNAADPEAEQIAIGVRRDPHLIRVPMIALCPEVGDLGFAAAFSWGADDAVSLAAARSLTARLRVLPREAAGESLKRRGPALVADPDPAHRVIYGRVLRNAGYDVSFAVTREDARQFAADAALQLLVLSTDIEEEPRALIEDMRERGSRAICVVNTAPRSLRSCRGELAGLVRVAANDSYAPAEDVLFLANDLRKTEQVEQRASARILYGTTVAFRGAGRHEDELGFTYNVSVGGLYVRTLAVPEDDLVWLELCPPRMERRVRLVAQVQWRRRFGYTDSATVPAGFGVKIVDGARDDLDAWNRGYGELADTLG